jgi:hypothetical protein
MSHARQAAGSRRDARVHRTGSQNVSTTSPDENREQGLVIGDPGAVSVLSHTFEQDWALAADAR